MQNTSYIGLSRQAALWRQLEVVANNMANANTPAFKEEQMMFREYLVPTRSSDRAMGDKLSFVQDVGVMRDVREGPLTKTDNPLDLAIHGDGYFQVETESGMRYGRNGHFRLDQIFAPNETRIEISGDGSVSTEIGRVAKLKVVDFANDQELKNAGDGLFESTQDPETVARPNVVQGMMEESNVQPVVEMTRMTQILREYEGVQKMIDAESDRVSKAMQILSNAKAS